MKAIIIIAVFLELGVFYWGEYLIKDPIIEDLKSFCEFRKNEIIKSQLKGKLLHPESLKLLPVFEENYSHSNDEILKDFARSKKRKFDCH